MYTNTAVRHSISFSILNLRIHGHRRDRTVWRSGPRTSQRVCCRGMQGSHCSHAKVSQILQFRQVGQLQVKRIDHEPAVYRQDTNDGPAEHHQDIIGEDQVVQDGKEQESDQSEH